MRCSNPWSAVVTPTGLAQMRPVLKYGRAPGDSLFRCGECYACAARETWEWATRIGHDFETEGNGHGYMVTLTYAPEHLPLAGPHTGTLVKRDVQLFNKRLRRRTGPFRFFLCGEYGSKRGRAHYHSLIWGAQLQDLQPWRTRKKRQIFRSPQVESAWPFGHSEVEEISTSAVHYVAGYVQKKLGPSRRSPAYRPDGAPLPAARLQTDLTISDLETWTQTHFKEREFRLMSGGQKAKGLGYNWILRNHEYVYPKDFLWYKGKRYAPPRYYDQVMTEELGEEWRQDLIEARRDRFEDARMSLEDWRHMRVTDAGLRLKRERMIRDLA